MANILIVEDDIALCETLQDLLTAGGHEVTVAGEGSLALATLRASAIRTVVLLDVRLPNGTGLDVLRQVVADPRITVEHAFVFVTAYPHMLPLLTGAESGNVVRVVVPVVSKPFKSAVLLAQIEKAARMLA
jgi:CheY-like chemotaxis protein